MPPLGAQTIYTSPQTQQHLRSTLAAIKQYIDTLTDTSGLVENQTFTSATSAGQLLYADGAGSVGLADADAAATARVIGFARADVGAGDTGSYQISGIVEVEDWTAATGGANLTPGSRYFLSSTVGQMTTTAPTAAGKFAVPVGIAITTKMFAVNIQRQVKL